MNTMIVARQSVSSLALLALLLFNACGGEDANNTLTFQQPATAATPAIAFVANQGSNNVSAYTINGSTGGLVPAAGSPFPTGGTTPAGIAVSPDGTLAYVANQ